MQFGSCDWNGFVGKWKQMFLAHSFVSAYIRSQEVFAVSVWASVDPSPLLTKIARKRMVNMSDELVGLPTSRKWSCREMLGYTHTCLEHVVVQRITLFMSRRRISFHNYMREVFGGRARWPLHNLVMNVDVEECHEVTFVVILFCCIAMIEVIMLSLHDAIAWTLLCTLPVHCRIHLQFVCWRSPCRRMQLTILFNFGV